MDGKVTWSGNLTFEAVGNSEKPIFLDSSPDPAQKRGPSPMEMIALSMAGCSAMDVISILQKKQQDVTGFEVRVHADRAAEHPKVYTRAHLEFRVTGRDVQEAAVARAIELSLTKYCSVHAMLEHAFPIDASYVVLQDEGEGSRRVVAEGTFIPPVEME